MMIHTEVTKALTPESGGRIKCRIENGSPPYFFEWLQGDNSALLTLSDDRSEAWRVPPGVYEIRVHDCDDNTCETRVEVMLEDLPRVVRYEVVNATSDTARDGSIVVHVTNMLCSRFLWTTGVVTNTPQLHDVRPGLYTATPLSHDDIPLIFYHTCPPANVLPSRNPAGEA